MAPRAGDDACKHMCRLLVKQYAALPVYGTIMRVPFDPEDGAQHGKGYPGFRA
jgi:hypothetical protein